MNNVAQNILRIIIDNRKELDEHNKVSYMFPKLTMFGLEVSVRMYIWLNEPIDDDSENPLEIMVLKQSKVYFKYQIISLDDRYFTGEYVCPINEFMTKFGESMDEFKLIKYSKTSGFYKEKKHFIDPIEFLFLETDDIKLGIQDCCVCYDKTKYMLKCSHYLCSHCHEKLKKEKCPICRKCIQCDDDCNSDDDDE